MKTERVVLHLQEGTLKGYLQKDPELSDNIKVFAGSTPEYFNIIVNNNSPLGPPFRLAAMELVEQGILDHVMMDWLGRDIGSGSSGSLGASMALRPSQVALVFFILLCLVVTSLIILTIEKMLKNTKQ